MDAIGRTRALAISTWALGGLVFLLTWGGGIDSPYTPSIDDSLHAGLNMAAVEGLDFGTELVFTYGPLGFLKSYLVFYEWPARLAGLYGLTLHLALSVSLVWAIRRHFPLVVAVALSVVTAVLARGDLGAVAVRDDAAVVILALIWTVAAISPRTPEWVGKIVVYGGPPFAALEILAKLNTGIIVAALVTIAIVARAGDRRRNLAIAASLFGASLTVLWFASGQGVGNVGAFISSSFEVISGYSSGARLEWDAHAYDYPLAAVLVIAAGVITWLSTRAMERGARIAISLIVAITAFTAVKGGFVSHDIFHMATFYATILGVIVVLPLPESRPIRAGVLVAAIAAIGAAWTTSFPEYPLTDPIENVSNAATTVATLADPGKLEREIEANRAELVSRYDIDPETLALLEGRSVHVLPSEAAAVWAHELEWEPLPVFQPYVAWTPALDEQNADAVASAEGPDIILRQNLNALGRYPAFESPAAMIEMLCRFRPIRTTDQWQVLARASDRCGTPERLGSARGTYGEPIPIPPAPEGSIVFARVHGVEVSGLERLRSTLLRARGRTVSFNGGVTPYIFYPATAADGLLVRAPVEIDPRDAYGLAANSDEMIIYLDEKAADEEIEVEFFSMAVRT